MYRDEPENPQKGFKQARGYAFEAMLFDLLNSYGLDPRRSYRPKGEQIDGTFSYFGRFYLLEAKWTADPIAASELYAFKGKVDGKLTGTIGVFFSMSGYAKDAVDALLVGKAVNLLLFDREDWELCLDARSGFVKVLDAKLRFAADEGSPYFPARKAMPQPASVIVTEGTLDRELVRGILQQVEPEVLRSVELIAAGGSLNTVNIAKAILERGPGGKIVVILDDDEVGQVASRMIAVELGDRVHVILATPYLDTIIEDQINERFNSYSEYRMRNYRSRQTFASGAISGSSPDRLRKHPVVTNLLAALSPGRTTKSQS